MRVLLIEDVYYEAQQIKIELAGKFPNPTFDEIRTESEFLAQFENIKSSPPSLIIMDLMLRWADSTNDVPGHSNDGSDSARLAGIRCLKLIMRDERTRSIPVVIYSSTTRDLGSVREQLGDLPPNVFFLPKEDRISGLVRLIRSLIAVSDDNQMSLPRVFIVHGHDNESKETLARFTEKLGLETIILHEKASRGESILTKLEQYADVVFAIVLLTADDVGASKLTPQDLRPRARQNVIFELGFFLAKLGRHHVCALVSGGVDIPSDYDGIIYINMDPSGAWRMELVREIRSAGLEVDLNRIV